LSRGAADPGWLDVTRDHGHGHDHLAFEVAPGSLVYFGRFSAHVHGRQVDTEWYHDPKRELEVWKAVRGHYSPSPWDSVLDRRIAFLADSLAGSR
jgi:hypothetical protein